MSDTAGWRVGGHPVPATDKGFLRRLWAIWPNLCWLQKTGHLNRNWNY